MAGPEASPDSEPLGEESVTLCASTRCRAELEGTRTGARKKPARDATVAPSAAASTHSTRSARAAIFVIPNIVLASSSGAF
eukprot:CAMPEP_0180370424 /NCGR_PEP_ID=MMETSP0989-20121125/19054_1 /TAXON_ID=697907 /ORGANISM="non described non described, Strain CCMP2293" /LENGTH=80 /DNA_ID=CAMNT_0022365931 /DNA_START=416 /DNA_END=655 /DNA_ORIENTATION=-